MRAPIVAALLLLPGLALGGEPAPANPPPPDAPTAPKLEPTAPPELPSDNPTVLVEINPGGLTADMVAARAQEASLAVRQQQMALVEAAAKVDETFYAFFPRLNTQARYTRLSDIEPPVLGGGGGSLVVTRDAPGTPNPQTFAAPPDIFKFPVILNNYAFTASLAVPLSDYALRISKAAQAAASAKDAAEANALAAKAKAQSDARIAFYNWLRTLGAVTVTEQTLADKKAHLADAKTLFDAGSVSKVDVLRAEADVTNGEQQVEKAKSLSRLAEKALRIQLQDDKNQPFKPGEPLDGPVPAVEGDLGALTERARTARPELKAIDATKAALEHGRAITGAARLPQVIGTADATYANPNQRIFPSKEEFNFTWSAGVVLTWSPNDLLVTGQQVKQQDARIETLMAQRAQLVDGLTLETTSAWEDFGQAQFAINATKRTLVAAEEAYRVAQVLYRAGRLPQAALEDVDTQVTFARLQILNAQADLKIARVKLDHATGDDARRIAAK